jgi:hypothetical protein
MTLYHQFMSYMISHYMFEDNKMVKVEKAIAYFKLSS